MTTFESIKLDLINISKQIDYADASFELFVLMKYGNKNWEKNYSISPAFFSLSIYSIFYQSILTIAKIFKNTNGSEKNINKIVTLVHSIKELNKNEDIQQTIICYRENYESYKVLINKLSIWRDKLIAHNDSMYFHEPSNIDSIASLDIEEIRGLIKFGRDIINQLSERLFNEDFSVRFYNYDDIEHLMYELSKHRKKEFKDIIQKEDKCAEQR